MHQPILPEAVASHCARVAKLQSRVCGRTFICMHQRAGRTCSARAGSIAAASASAAASAAFVTRLAFSSAPERIFHAVADAVRGFLALRTGREAAIGRRVAHAAAGFLHAPARAGAALGFRGQRSDAEREQGCDEGGFHDGFHDGFHGGGHQRWRRRPS